MRKKRMSKAVRWFVSILVSLAIFIAGASGTVILLIQIPFESNDLKLLVLVVFGFIVGAYILHPVIALWWVATEGWRQSSD